MCVSVLSVALSVAAYCRSVMKTMLSVSLDVLKITAAAQYAACLYVGVGGDGWRDGWMEGARQRGGYLLGGVC